MKTKKCSGFFLLALMTCLLFSTICFAQKGPYRYSRAYHVHYYPYPVYSYGHPYVSIPYGGYVYRYQQGCFLPAVRPRLPGGSPAFWHSDLDFALRIHEFLHWA